MMTIAPAVSTGSWVSYLKCETEGCGEDRHFEGASIDAVHQAMNDAGWQLHPSICPGCRQEGHSND